jgi:hypothetical protein
MGQTPGKGSWLMPSNPPKAAQAIAAVFLPCACREEVLGDLQERCTSPMHYCRDTFRTVPLVILSRIRRTADTQLLLMHAFVLYLSFYGAAWFKASGLLYEPWGLARLAIPGAVTMLAMVLEDAYAKPGHRSPLRLVRGPLLGLGWVLLSQAAFWTSHSSLTLPLWIVMYGGALGLLLTSALRLLFSPPSTSPQGRI